MTIGSKPGHLVRLTGAASMKQPPDCFDIPGRRKRLDLSNRRGAARSVDPVPVISVQRLG